MQRFDDMFLFAAIISFPLFIFIFDDKINDVYRQAMAILYLIPFGVGYLLV